LDVRMDVVCIGCRYVLDVGVYVGYICIRCRYVVDVRMYWM